VNTKIKVALGMLLALLVAIGGGWFWGASGRWPAQRALEAAELRGALLEGRGRLLDAQVDLFNVNFGNASRHLEDARAALGRASERLANAGRTADVKKVEAALRLVDEAQRTAARLDQGANARVADAVRTVDEVLGAPPPPSASIEVLPQVEQRILDLTNGERTRSGLPPLEYDRNLAAAAREHSVDMLRRGFFDHTNPDDESPASRVARIAGTPIAAVAENIWMRSGDAPPQLDGLADQAMTDLMASDLHRDNILRLGDTHVGVGVAILATNVRVTQIFMRRGA